MALIADILMISGAFGAALYCMILSRRLNKFSDLDGGVGKAIADLNAEVAELAKTLHSARVASEASVETLSSLTERAEAVALRLEQQLGYTETGSPRTRNTPKPGKTRPPQPQDKTAKADAAETSSPMPAFVRGRSTRTAAE
ncbi:MAG: hypothetical protein AAGF94_01820 [Pseudomonadota bacterium]